MTATLGPVHRAKSGGRRFVTAIGVMMILAGVGFLSYFLWQYFGTNVVSKHRQQDVKQTLVQDWGKGLDGDAIGLLRVKRLGADYETPIVKTFSDDALARGVGWYEEGAKPGETGNFAIAGHRVTHGEPFRDFLKLRKGDKVVVETRTNVFTYKLRGDGGDITVDFTVGWPLWNVPDPEARDKKPTKALLTMLTCAELFHTDNRNVVIGDLVSEVDKSASTSATTG